MFNVWGIKLPGYFSFVAAVGLCGCRTISWPGWVTSSNLRLLACKTITILVTFRQASSFPLSSILMIRFTLNRQVACKDSLRGYFCINSCDEVLAGTDSKTFFHHCCTLEENPPSTSSRCRHEAGQTRPCYSPMGLWPGVSISRKALWSSYLYLWSVSCWFNGQWYYSGLYINTIWGFPVCNTILIKPMICFAHPFLKSIPVKPDTQTMNDLKQINKWSKQAIQ